ncbi:MAG: hypothetical protein SFY70_11920 [Bacteroidia bacterium]|nr:hypothetical protein [Bacteroidia bacterium]
MAAAPSTPLRKLSYGLLLASAVATLVVPVLLLNHYGYAKEMQWTRLLGIFLAALAGLGAGLGLAFGGTGLVSTLSNAVGSSLGAAAPALVPAVLATVATTAVVVTSLSVAPPASEFNLAAERVQAPIEVPESLAQYFGPTDSVPDASLPGPPPIGTLADGSTPAPAAGPTESPTRTETSPAPTPADAPAAKPDAPATQTTDALASSEAEDRPAEPAAPSAGSAEREAEVPVGGADSRARKTQPPAAAQYAETDLAPYAIALVLRLPLGSQTAVTRVEKMTEGLTPRATEWQLGPGKPYRVLVGPPSPERVSAAALKAGVRRDPRVVSVSEGSTQAQGWRVLRIVRQGSFAVGDDTQEGYAAEYLLFANRGSQGQLVKLFSPNLYPTLEQALAEAQRLEARLP